MNARQEQKFVETVVGSVKEYVLRGPTSEEACLRIIKAYSNEWDEDVIARKIIFIAMIHQFEEIPFLDEEETFVARLSLWDDPPNANAAMVKIAVDNLPYWEDRIFPEIQKILDWVLSRYLADKSVEGAKSYIRELIAEVQDEEYPLEMLAHGGNMIQWEDLVYSR
jgi:hypothetical protein